MSLPTTDRLVGFWTEDSGLTLAYEVQHPATGERTTRRLTWPDQVTAEIQRPAAVRYLTTSTRTDRFTAEVRTGVTMTDRARSLAASVLSRFTPGV